MYYLLINKALKVKGSNFHYLLYIFQISFSVEINKTYSYNDTFNKNQSSQNKLILISYILILILKIKNSESFRIILPNKCKNLYICISINRKRLKSEDIRKEIKSIKLLKISSRVEFLREGVNI